MLPTSSYAYSSRTKYLVRSQKNSSFFCRFGGVALFHVRGSENVRRRTFWLGAISPPFGLVQRPASAHFNRSDTVDILSITFYSFILRDLDPTVAIESSFADLSFTPRFQGRTHEPGGGAAALMKETNDGPLVGAPGSGHRRAFCGLYMTMLGEMFCFAPWMCPFQRRSTPSRFLGRAQTFAKMTGLLPCGSWLGVSIARPLQAPVLGSQNSLRFMLLRPRAGCSRWKC